MGKRVYMAVTNDLITDNRVHKIAQTLIKSDAEVTLLGAKKFHNTPVGPRPYLTRRFAMIFKKGFLFYAEYNLRLFIFLLFKKFDILVCNDLDTLLAGYCATFIRRKKVVYDSHEFFTEVPELVNRNFPRKVWLLLEQMLLPRIKYSYTVSESIANTYQKLYNIDMKVVRNLPLYNYKSKDPSTTNSEPRLILYQGALNVGRGLEQMIDAIQFMDNVHLFIIGEGDLMNQLKQQVKEKHLEGKITLKGRIPFQDLPVETRKADLGIALEENIGLNYYYALPNKLFDYIQSGVPVLVSPFPEMQKIVNNYKIGTVYDHKDPQRLAEKIQEIFELKKRYQQWKKNTQNAAKELCWENEEKILKNIFSKVGLNF
ncbi:MAG: glycosyltransferase [Bacteroidales bacterium]|jgi:glycosyltransferase involved in cell wall biosynthesis|nr:glycosyltransferase [Bacteroidales bacterium]